MSTAPGSYKPFWPGIAPQIVATLDKSREARAMVKGTIPYEGTVEATTGDDE